MRWSLQMASTSPMPTQLEPICARSPLAKPAPGRFPKALSRGQIAGSRTARIFWSCAWEDSRRHLPLETKPLETILAWRRSAKAQNDALGGRVSPDGSRIAYLPGPRFSTELWVMDSDGANPRKVVSAGRRDQPGSLGSWITPWSGPRTDNALHTSNAISLPDLIPLSRPFHWRLSMQTVTVRQLFWMMIPG